MSTTEATVADIARDPMWYRTYKRVQAVLDEALGTEVEGGEGSGRRRGPARITSATRRGGNSRRPYGNVLTAEAALARIATHCRRRLDTAIVQGAGVGPVPEHPGHH